MKSIFAILIFGIMFFPITLIICDMSKDICTKQPKKKKYSIQDEMNMLDEAKWVEKVIKSCKTYKQLIVADKLSSILRDKYHNKVDSKLLFNIENKLDQVWLEIADRVTYG